MFNVREFYARTPREKSLLGLSFRKTLASLEQTVFSRDTVNQVTVSLTALAIRKLREMNKRTECHGVNTCELILSLTLLYSHPSLPFILNHLTFLRRFCVNKNQKQN